MSLFDDIGCCQSRSDWGAPYEEYETRFGDPSFLPPPRAYLYGDSPTMFHKPASPNIAPYDYGGQRHDHGSPPPHPGWCVTLPGFEAMLVRLSDSKCGA
jgi:hypothetical protein